MDNKIDLNYIESDRRRIAGDLHDSTVQMLTMLTYKTELAQELLESDPLRARNELEMMKNSLRLTIDQIRQIIFNLSPITIDRTGLIPTVENYIMMLRQYESIEFSFYTNCKTEPTVVSPHLKLTVFRIIQEACSNAIKYSKCSKVNVGLIFKDNEIEAYILDNGVGFDFNTILQQNRSTNNLGLSIMKERVSFVNGRMNIQTDKTGTDITIKIPIQ